MPVDVSGRRGETARAGSHGRNGISLPGRMTASRAESTAKNKSKLGTTGSQTRRSTAHRERGRRVSVSRFGAAIYAFGCDVDIFKNVAAFMTPNGKGFESARKSRFSLTRHWTLACSQYAAITESPDLNPLSRYDLIRPSGMISSSSMAHPISRQNVWQSLRPAARKFRPTSSTTIRGRCNRKLGLLTVRRRMACSQSVAGSSPKAKMYTLLSKQISKSLPHQFFPGLFDPRHDFVSRHALELRAVPAFKRNGCVERRNCSRGIRLSAISAIDSIPLRFRSHVDTVLNPSGQVKAAAA